MSSSSASLDSRFGAYDRPAARAANRFTPREHELIALLVDRHRRRAITEAARSLGISVHTARSHVRAIANRIPNPHGLPALKLIVSYFEHLPSSALTTLTTSPD